MAANGDFQPVRIAMRLSGLLPCKKSLAAVAWKES
jgi:hypothetical protein